jgi:hypothetical protein
MGENYERDAAKICMSFHCLTGHLVSG